MNPKYHMFADGLPRIGAIKFGNFTLKSGLKSPVYVDLRLLRSYPTLLRAGAEILYDLVMEGPQFDRIADIPTAASPLVTALSIMKDLPAITPRDPKDHGTKATIEGHFEIGMAVRLIDDLVTKAGSKFESIRILETSGLIVPELCVLVDREQGGTQELQQKGYNLRSAFTLRQLVNRYVSASPQLITSAQHDEVIAYLDAERDWLAKAT